MFTQTSHLIKITAVPTYIAEHSLPQEHRYVWAYTIRIENLGAVGVRLLTRYWHITDGGGQVQEVRGPGVVGEQPTLRPGDSFTYTSSVMLSTPTGIMRGHYEMMTATKELLTVQIPVFSLDSPTQMARPN